MKTFRLSLSDATRRETFDEVVSFVGEDASGSFGILAGHARLMTSLLFGLARFRRTDGAWHYLAFPGALLYFVNDELSISTRRFLLDDNYERISTALQSQLLAEEKDLHTMKESLHRMEQELLRRLSEMNRTGGSNL
jgi:F-type H+-transporting ATPase subunit epsilon